MTETRPTAGASVAKVKIEAWLAAVLMVVSFGVGFVVRAVVTEDQQPAPIEQQVPGMPPGLIQEAPPLAPDQLTGELPEGHVPVDPNAPAPTPALSSSPAMPAWTGR